MAAAADTEAQSIKALERFAANLGQVKYNAHDILRPVPLSDSFIALCDTPQMNEILERTDSQVQKLTDKMRVVEQKVVRLQSPTAHHDSNLHACLQHGPLTEHMHSSSFAFATSFLRRATLARHSRVHCTRYGARRRHWRR